MATYILVDSLNMFMRSKHSVGGRDLDMRLGMSLHIMFSSIAKAWRDFSGDHVVVALEGRSWRKDENEFYKLNRKTQAAQRTEREVEEDALFMEAYTDFVNFLSEKTNVSVVRHPNAEADDIIASWIQNHPEDQHVIVSTDSDFIQLLAPNVKIYNGVTGVTIHHDRVLNDRGQNMEFSVKNDGKVKVGKPDPDFTPEPDWYQFALFVKCIRGDAGDNVFSAFPGVRMRGTKNTTGIQDAYRDKQRSGYDYNNFMLQTWCDHNGVEHRVKDRYEENVRLIDLTAQPDWVKQGCREVITECVQKDKASQVGLHFMKFCAKWQLLKLSDRATEHAQYLNAGIPE